MDATSTIKETQKATTTSNPVSNRKQATDAYLPQNPTVILSGVVSSIKTLQSANVLSMDQYLDGLESAMDSLSPVFLKKRLSKAEEGNWFITSFTREQDNKNGFGTQTTSGTIIESCRVSLTLTRNLFAKGLQATTNVPNEFRDLLEEKQEVSSSTGSLDESTPKGKKASEKTQENISSLNKLMGRFLTEVITGEAEVE